MATRSRSNPNQLLQTQYLVGYNLVCAVLWSAVLGRVILLVPLVGFGNVHGGVGEFTKWTQTLALLEIVHSASGMSTRADPLCLQMGGGALDTFLIFPPPSFPELSLIGTPH